MRRVSPCGCLCTQSAARAGAARQRSPRAVCLQRCDGYGAIDTETLSAFALLNSTLRGAAFWKGSGRRGARTPAFLNSRLDVLRILLLCYFGRAEYLADLGHKPTAPSKYKLWLLDEQLRPMFNEDGDATRHPFLPCLGPAWTQARGAQGSDSFRAGMSQGL